jgi:periplasmic protein TonB
VLTVALLGGPETVARPMPPPRLRVEIATVQPLVDASIPVNITYAEPPAVAAAPAVPSQVVAATAALATADLMLLCPQRRAPAYPPLARQLREQGEVRMRVGIDERGRVDEVVVIGSSGSPRLDAAARAAVLEWRCEAASRNGHPERAVALQSLSCVLARGH